MKKVLAFTLLVGCGDGLPDKEVTRECHVYNSEYSHTVLFCGGQDIDDVEDVFQVCNHRHRVDNQIDGCTPNFDLMDFDDDCTVRNVCWSD